MKKHLVALATLAAISAIMPAQAQFGSFKNPLAANSGGKQVDADAVKKTVVAALGDLASANSLYAQALGKEKEAATLKEIADSLKNSGSLGVDPGKAISSIKEASASTIAEMKTRQEAKEKLSDDAKQHLVDGLVFHVSGTAQGVNGTKQLKAALESRSPAVLAALVGIKDFPGLFGEWTSATANVLSYMRFNGIDTAEADKAISAAMSEG